MDPSVGSRGPLFDDKLDHISFQKLFWSINHLVKVSHKNWSTFLLQKTPSFPVPVGIASGPLKMLPIQHSHWKSD